MRLTVLRELGGAEERADLEVLVHLVGAAEEAVALRATCRRTGVGRSARQSDVLGRICQFLHVLHLTVGAYSVNTKAEVSIRISILVTYILRLCTSTQ